MEAATLSNPQRKYEVVPVQKSLSLPSYAKAGGEGIDHRIIFAALEQKEKVRRKSVIFKREKTARPNIFCLPIPSSAKCRETSLSSDTSCSSLEYQKPKAASKPKKEVKPSKNETTPVSEPSVIKTSQSEIETNPSHHEVASANGAVDQERQQSQQTVAEYFRKGYRSPSATLRPNINSSDSMDRSSRSSNDSLSRKERLVAIKAKVEAAREKYGDTSSEDEKRGGITRYNSDGVIHRTVKEVKSRSNRLEKRLRRRSQDEYAMRKANRKNNLSLCLSSVDDGINLDLYNSPLNVLEGEQNLECKTDFCPSPNFLDFTKKNYFSDFPSKENMTRMVQTRIRQIEEEERKRRHSLDFRDKTRQSLQNIENSSPSSTQRRNAYSSDKAMSNATSEGFNCPSPVGRAPTPPPRSPKSISFVNIAYMQHKNSSLKQNIRSLERKKFYNPIISATEWEVKDLFKVRRKTCSHFDYTEDFAIKDLSSKPDRSPIYPDIAKKWRNQGTNVSPSQSSAKLLNTKGYFSNNEGSPVLSESPHRVCRSKWEETEKKQEFMFNSLESKKRTVSPSWIKSGTPQKTNSCFCHFLTGDKSICLCEHGEKQRDRFVCHGDDDDMKLGGSYDYYVALKREQEARSRLSKSEANVSCSEQTKHKLYNPNFADAEVKDQNDAKRDNWHGEKQTDRFVCHGDDDDIKFGGSYDYDDDMKLGGSYDYYVALKREQEVRSRLSKSIANVSCSKLKHKLHNPNFADAEVKDQNDARRDNWQNENLSATANLDIAMEELEKVYRSLKFSGDIVSEKNSDSNLSLNDLNTDASRNLDLNKNTDISLKPCPTKGNNIDFYENISYNVKPVFNGGHEGICISPAYSSISSNAPSKSLDTENICIDELFNDLTRQLNIEQKFLKDHRDNRNENRSISLENDNCDKRESRRMGSLDSIVSIRKELYNNLQKSSQERMKPLDSLFIALNSQKEKLEKQAKMVESFSERISNLEANVNSFPVKKNMLQNSEPSSYNMETCPNTSPKPYKHPVKPPQIEAKKEVQQPIVPEKASKSILEIIPMPNIMDFNPKIKELLFENSGSSNYNMETTPSMSPKLYKHALKPSQIETKKEVLLEQAALSEGALISDILKKQVEEIRQLRVSMGWDVSEVKPMPKSQFHDYPRLSSAVSKPHATSRNESQCLPPSNILKEPIEVLNEYDLETLLNTLVNDVSEAKQSSPLLSNGNPPSTPPPAPSSGKCDHVKYKRNFMSKMDSYMAATTKNKISECSQRLKSEEVAQVKKDFRQTNSAHLNQMSFIPVYSNKTLCHKFSTSSEIPCENQLEKKALMTYSPPSRPRYTAGNNDIAARFTKTHMRRRSIGFEDMTSLSSCYGHNFSNDRRFQGSVHNSNVSQSFTENNSVNFNSGDKQSLGKGSLSENSEFSSFNHNAQLSSGENANDHLQCRTEISLQRHKDKSSKRKSSLNRIDFIQFPSNTGKLQSNSESPQRQNSSSDECNEGRLHIKKSESSSGTAKRKHSASNFNNTISKSEVKTNEITLNNSSATKLKSNLIPRSSQIGHSSPRPYRWKPSSTIRFSQKLSHSAGELELLTDLSEVPNRNKTCFSAQEYDDFECRKISNANPAGAISRNRICRLSPQHLNKNEDTLTIKSNCDNTSQIEVIVDSANDVEHSAEKKLASLKLDNENSYSVDQKETTNIEICSEEFNPSNSDCDDLKVHNDIEVYNSALKLENIEIIENDSKISDIYLSADESGDFGNSDSERRPSSILRKKSFEEKKELHSILKTPADDKLSKAPPSILKHRESSEEKEAWQQPNDLHSILKKSTSEDESCNSGPDIRPILKLSTDEDSSSGAVRPRPILKKRTSFNDECSYVSFPCGELKPILKKKTPLSSEEQPKPILKSRRKSEDTRSTMSEVITSRPRAYSADMGVKVSHEGRIENSEVKRDFHKLNSHNL